MNRWFIEGYFTESGQGDEVMRRLPVHVLPFRVGRQDGLELSLDAGGLSRVHAELYEDGGLLFVRDLDSTNGTFVNHKIVRGERALRHGDVVHVGNVEFRIISQHKQAATNPTMTMVGMDALSNRLPTGIRELQELIDRQAAVAVFQPIVDTADESLHAFEVLGRGDYAELPESPGELFRIAESAGLEVPLSELMRFRGFEQAALRNNGSRLFLNTHPRELRDTGRLLASLAGLQERFGERSLVLEIHEQGVTDLAAMARLRDDLARQGIELAYDDFGAGQARLLELIEAPPAYLKFDMAFVRNIDRAPEAKLEMLASLLAMTHKMGIRSLAEGTSREEEVAACRRLGFHYIQGYFFGRPAPLPV